MNKKPYQKPTVSDPATTAEGACRPLWVDTLRSVPEAEHDRVREALRHERNQDPRPNILLVFTDQQTINAMSCAGNPWVRTPNMDSLARRGTRFTRSYCAFPICGPSRACMMTGKAPAQTGVHYNGDPLRKDCETIGHVLSRAGYDCTYTGKWHLPDSYVATEDGIPGYHNLPLPEGLEWPHLGSVTDMQVAVKAGRYLRWYAGLSPRPWFLTVSLHNPHDICYHGMRNTDYLALLEPDPDQIDVSNLPPLPANFQIPPDEPKSIQDRRNQIGYADEMNRKGEWTEAQWRAYLQTYYHLVQQVDRCLRPILDGLQAGGWLENTVLLFTSDHGEGVAAHQWMSKLSLYDESIQVPFIALPPGAWSCPQARVDAEHLVSGLDLMPTCLDYAEVSRSIWPKELAGMSIRPLLEGRECEWRSELVVEIAMHPDRPEDRGKAIIREDGTKEIFFPV